MSRARGKEQRLRSEAGLPRSLDGVTIMRYAPICRKRSNGGVEQYLRCLDHGLLQRHRATVLQVHRVDDVRTTGLEIEQIGKGHIVWIPVPYQTTQSRFTDLPSRARFIYEQTIPFYKQNREGREQIRLGNLKTLLAHEVRHLRHRVVILSDSLSFLLASLKVDLLAVHGLTYDAGQLIVQAKKIGIPFVLINHFDNAHFSRPAVRKWIPDAAGIGAVSARGMPDSLCGRCVNLSDAIDTEFFTPNKEREGSVARPIILLPAIIKPGKGHEDLLKAAGFLAARNLDFQISFAGAVGSECLRRALLEQAVAAGLEHRVVFLGELRQEQIRDYYGLSSVVVLPTYCEGLGRCLLEAQAMQKPVVAYDSGGVGDTMLPNETGFLVKTGDVELLADRIGFLLKAEAERRRLGRRGREFVIQQFSICDLIRRHELFYSEALGSSHCC